jgi:pimeloyl-ACP methyl ester carboxylesterase
MNQIVKYKNGNSLSYAEYGDKNGYPILIQHGMIASIRDHHLFARLIASGTRLICIARSGYGESSPYPMKNMAEWGEIVSVLVDELKLSQFDILGMSSGAPYSYAIGYKLPDKVRNIFIFSGTPALYDDNVIAFWPYPVNKQASITELEKLAHELFFSNLSKEDLTKNDIKDSMMNNCFGIAQDLQLRCMDWGFKLSDINEYVYMQHSRADNAVPFITAEITSKLLPHCRLVIKENDAHFSDELLDNFIKTAMVEYYESKPMGNVNRT